MGVRQGKVDDGKHIGLYGNTRRLQEAEEEFRDWQLGEPPRFTERPTEELARVRRFPGGGGKRHGT